MARRLAAILAADVEGYSRMMAADEDGTLAALKAFRAEIFDPNVRNHRGRIVKLMGDGALVEFASVVDAVECAVSIQTAKPSGTEDVRLRIGINVGDVITEGGDIYGDGVNLAARLESLADPGGICISGMAHESLGNRVDIAFADTGLHELKNIDRPIRVFRWRPEGRRKSAPPAFPGPDKPSIAVMAFDNMSDDPGQEFFSDGIAEDIITELSHFREFFVIARNSSFTYKGQPIRVDQVCRELGVRYLLEGSVRKAGNKVRVTAQLIDGEKGAHLWAAKFDRDLDDIFAVQDEITRSIVAAVAPETMDAELRRSRSGNAASLTSWQKILHARWHLARLTREDNDAARRWIDEVIASAPDLSDCFSMLARCELQGMLHLWREDAAAAIRSAVGAARHAVSLDENDAEAHAMVGMAELFARNFDEATIHLETAIRLNPNSAHAHGTLGALHGVAGEYAAAQASAELALALSPRDPSKTFWLGGVGIGAYLVQEYEDCVSISRRVLSEYPGYASSMRQETAALAMLGRKEEASGALRRLLERMPGLTVEQVRNMVPIRYPDGQAHWLEGLRRAGLPEA